MAENYPVPGFHFQVEWGGTKIDFTEVSGLNVETEVLEYRHGRSFEFHTTKMPGMQKTSNITLKRGVFKGDNDYYKWWNSIEMNKVTRRQITISLLDEKHEPVVTWSAKNAWPIKVEGPSLNAKNNEVAIESMEVVHEGLTVVNPK